jgi:hypothetical protein
MALSKRIVLESGVETTYHRISILSLDATAKQVTVRIESYISEDTRKSGKVPASRITVTLNSVTVSVADAYTALKGTPELSGASDI